ncbi:MAG: hypothetical protein IKU48_05900 [Clostridia bacterium]|nr:hypothetical protein [Clostridia bacterium]
MKIAVVDIGSNTVKMKIYSVNNGILNETYSEINNAKLISYISSGTLSVDGIFLLCSIINHFKAKANENHADIFKCFATASLRRTQNIDEITSAVLYACQEEIDLVSGEDEAFYSFSGVKNTTPLFPDEAILLDMGGGSTEIVHCISAQRKASESMGFGSLSLYLDFDGSNFDAMKSYATESFKKTKLYPLKSTNAILVGGTALALCKLYSHFYKDSAEFCMTYDNLNNMYVKLKECNAEIVNLLSALVPHRVTTVIPGLAAYLGIFEEVGIKNITVSTCGIREGYVYEKILKNSES